MKYSVEFKKGFWGLFTLILILSALLALLNLLRLYEVPPFYSSSRPLEILSLSVSLLVAILMLLAAFGSSYNIDGQFLCVKIAFIPLIKIMLNEITNIREYKKQGRLMLGYISRKTHLPRALNIFIEKAFFDSFADELRRHNRDILYDINND